MTANEQHLLMTQATLDECNRLSQKLTAVQKIFTVTEPPRRDSSGHDVSQLSLRVYGQVSQAAQAAELLEDVLRRNRFKQLTDHTHGGRTRE